MSSSSKKGYALEHAVCAWFGHNGLTASRPRTTSTSDADCGDVSGLPFVVSCKNHNRIELSTWTDELATMVRRSGHDTGFVVHNRRGKGRVDEQYVTLPLYLMWPFIRAYIINEAGTLFAASAPPPCKHPDCST